MKISPDYGDGYYNMACIYSIMNKKALALRYLDIAALNGFKEVSEMEKDSDLKNIRNEPGYKKIIKKMSGR